MIRTFYHWSFAVVSVSVTLVSQSRAAGREGVLSDGADEPAVNSAALDKDVAEKAAAKKAADADLQTANAALKAAYAAAGDKSEAATAKVVKAEAAQTLAEAKSVEAGVDEKDAKEKASTAKTTESSDKASPFTIGTLLGVTSPLYDTTTYAVRSNIVYEKRGKSAWDYLQPSAYVLASVSIVSWGKKATPNNVSIIVPFGLTSKGKDVKDLSLGFGASVGFTTKAGAEIGFALALVWTQVPILDNSQRASLNGKTALGAGESDTIDTSLRPSLALGLYIAPTL